MSLHAPAAEAATGPMTIDQTVDFLNGQEQEEEQEQPVETPEATPAAETPNTEAEPAAAGDPGAETPTEEAGEQVEAQAAPIEPPQFWSVEAKARFREVPRDLQEILSAQEKNAVEYVTKTANEANETRKAAEAERTRLGALTEQLAKIVPQAEQTFADRWANIDWGTLTDQIGADQAIKLKFQHDAERDQLAQLRETQAKARTEQVVEHQKQVLRELHSQGHELVDQKEGKQRWTSLMDDLAKRGYPQEQIYTASTRDLQTAWESFMWRQSQAKAKELAAKPKPAAVQTAKPVASRPGLPGSASTPQSNRLQELSRKRSLSIDETVELMNLKDKMK